MARVNDDFKVKMVLYSEKTQLCFLDFFLRTASAHDQDFLFYLLKDSKPVHSKLFTGRDNEKRIFVFMNFLTNYKSDCFDEKKSWNPTIVLINKDCFSLVKIVPTGQKE